MRVGKRFTERASSHKMPGLAETGRTAVTLDTTDRLRMSADVSLTGQTASPSRSRRLFRFALPGRVVFFALVLLQSVCTGFFVYEVFGPMLGLRSTPMTWMAHELIEIGAALGLIMGLFFGIVAKLSSDARRRAAEGKLEALSGAFASLLEDRFDELGLTPAERDVAYFLVKGSSMQEIAGYRGTSEGTIKAQTAAIYRKAGVPGRAQLVSLFIEDLMDGELSAKDLTAA